MRQGCPLSIHLFAIYIEPLLVRLTNTLGGINLHGERVKDRAYVNDLTVSVSSNTDILRACGAIEEFCTWTHARINKAKTKLLGLGHWAVGEDFPVVGAGLQHSVTQAANVSVADREDPGSNHAPGSITSHKRKRGYLAKTWSVSWINQVSHLRLLGITFTANISQSTKLNWQSYHHKIDGNPHY